MKIVRILLIALGLSLASPTYSAASNRPVALLLVATLQNKPIPSTTLPAPEIDTSLAGSQVILLGGAILLIRGRRRR